jgi:ribosome maturation factor RimP
VVAERGPSGWAVQEIPLADITKAVVQVEFSSPNPRELQLAGVGDDKAGR